MISLIAFLLTLIGSANWFCIAVMQYDFVAGLFGSQANIFSRIVYGIIGLSAIWLIYAIIRGKGKIKIDGKRASDKELLPKKKDKKSKDKDKNKEITSNAEKDKINNHDDKHNSNNEHQQTDNTGNTNSNHVSTENENNPQNLENNSGERQGNEHSSEETNTAFYNSTENK